MGRRVRAGPERGEGMMISDKANETIRSMLNKPYKVPLEGQGKRFVCWKFCREIYSILGMQLPHNHSQRELTRITEPTVPSIVLFHAVVSWHSGVTWPDGLHFIHACPRNIFDPNPTEYIVHKDRLTIWPYKLIIEGYYCTGGAAVAIA